MHTITINGLSSERIIVKVSTNYRIPSPVIRQDPERRRRLAEHTVCNTTNPEPVVHHYRKKFGPKFLLWLSEIFQKARIQIDVDDHPDTVLT